jgi:hypothetical protein
MEFEFLAETTRNQFVVNIPSTMYEYQFSLKPKNSCGKGEFSRVAVIDSI